MKSDLPQNSYNTWLCLGSFWKRRSQLLVWKDVVWVMSVWEYNLQLPPPLEMLRVFVFFSSWDSVHGTRNRRVSKLPIKENCLHVKFIVELFFCIQNIVRKSDASTSEKPSWHHSSGSRWLSTFLSQLRSTLCCWNDSMSLKRLTANLLAGFL